MIDDLKMMIENKLWAKQIAVNQFDVFLKYLSLMVSKVRVLSMRFNVSTKV